MKKPLGCLPLLFPLFALLALALAEQKQKEPPLSTRPRGVPPQLTSFYQEREQFECLDGNMKISFEKVNDDYCDCADGSDEPGTAACRNSKFYCPNLGYQPSTIPSSRVNDFICDCCDGSDEWDSGTQCPNICEAQGSQAREDAKRQRAVQEAGWTKRKELAKEGQKMLEERRTELERKKTEVGELETQKEAAEERKKEAERVEADAKREQDAQWEAEKKRREAAEATALLKAADTDGDGKLSAEELKKHAGIDKLNLKESTTQNIEENEEEVGEGEGGNVGKAEEFEQLLKSIFTEEEQAVPAAALDQQRLEEKLYSVRDFLTRAAEAKRRKQGEEADNPEEEILSKAEEDSADASGGKPQYDEATQRVIAKADEARHEFEEVNKRVGQLQDEIRDSEQFLEFEYGADQAWAPLKGKCVELTNTQYTYKICLFDKTVQKDRGGYSEITLGYWGTWNGPEGGDKFSSQKYEHGQTCWNGPERTTEVLFECGDELELVEASEPSKCEYRFAMRAPTACRNPDELKHVEL